MNDSYRVHIQEPAGKNSINTCSKNGLPAQAACSKITQTCNAGTEKQVIARICFRDCRREINPYLALVVDG